MLQSIMKPKTPSNSEEIENRLQKSEAQTDTKLDMMETRLLDVINAVMLDISSLKTDIFSALGLE